MCAFPGQRSARLGHTSEVCAVLRSLLRLSGVTRPVGDPAEAERLVAETYLPNRLDLGRDRTPLAMELNSLRVGSLTAGRLTYCQPARVPQFL